MSAYQNISPVPAKRLLQTMPVDLRWASGLISADADRAAAARGGSLATLADEIEALFASANPCGHLDLLARAEPEMRWAANKLRVTDQSTQRHRANNLLQSAENARYVVDKFLTAA